MTPMRLEPAASQSRVKHSTTEPLCSIGVFENDHFTQVLLYTFWHTCNFLKPDSVVPRLRHCANQAFSVMMALKKCTGAPLLAGSQIEPSSESEDMFS